VLGEATQTPGVFTFRGTSAASPNAAAVAALALQLDPSLTPESIERLMAETATRLPSPYATVPESYSVGAGLVDAYAFLAEVPQAVTPQPARLAETGTDVPAGALLAGGLFVLAGVILVRSRRRTA
jgi:LPXTG-motif cell wall-anchored protein